MRTSIEITESLSTLVMNWWESDPCRSSPKWVSIALIKVQAPENKPFEQIYCNEDITIMTKDSLWNAKQITFPRILGAFATIGAMFNEHSRQSRICCRSQEATTNWLNSIGIPQYISYHTHKLSNHHSACWGWPTMAALWRNVGRRVIDTQIR